MTEPYSPTPLAKASAKPVSKAGKIFGKITPDKPLDLAFSLMENQWNGRRQLQLRLEDIRIHL